MDPALWYPSSWWRLELDSLSGENDLNMVLVSRSPRCNRFKMSHLACGEEAEGIIWVSRKSSSFSDDDSC